MARLAGLAKTSKEDLPPQSFRWAGFQMRCYFHLVNGSEVISDDTGIEVVDLESAKAEARRAIAELRQENGGANEDWSGWRLNIECPEGSLFHSLNLTATWH